MMASATVEEISSSVSTAPISSISTKVDTHTSSNFHPTILQWPIDKLFLLVAFVEYEVLPDDVDTTDLLKPLIDWDSICKKINSLPNCGSNYTMQDCEEQYNQLMQRVDREFKTDERSKPLISPRDKHGFILRTIGISRFYASRKRKNQLRKSIEDMVKKIHSLETEELDGLSDVSDGEGSDSEVESGNTEPPTARESFTEMFMKMFGVDNKLRLSNPEDATVDVILNSKLKLNETITISPTYTSGDMQGSTQCVSSQLKNLVRTKIADATEDDKSKASAVLHSPTNSPTLSKLLEMPPRDRGQPLPAIQSLMTSRPMEIDEDVQLDEMSPNSTLSLSQDSPAKLLASLGTSTTPVNIVMNTAVLPGLTINMPINQLKTLEDIEIANEYVMDSGLVQEGVDTTFDLPASVPSGHSSAVPISSIVIKSEKDDMFSSDAQIKSGSEANLDITIHQPDIKPNIEPTLQSVVRTTQNVSIITEIPEIVDKKPKEKPVIGTNYVKQDGNQKELKMVSPNKEPSDIELSEQAKEEKTETVDKKEHGDQHKGRGKKTREQDDNVAAPLTRNSIKGKSDAPDDNKTGKESTISRRSQTKSGVIDEKRIEKTNEAKATPKKVSVKTPAVDIHTPNLRSRRGPTPTPGSITTDEKHAVKIPEDEVELLKHKIKTEVDNTRTSDLSKESSPKKDKDKMDNEEHSDADSRFGGESHDSSETPSIKRKSVIPASRKERSESGDMGDDDNSNSGNDASSKKRITRRSAKIILPKTESKSLQENNPDGNLTKEENGQSGNDSKPRHSKSLSRLKSLHEEANQVCGPIDIKEENADGKRVTRARAQTSTSPRTRTKSTGSTKSQVNSSDPITTGETADPGPSRATRSRTSFAPSSTPKPSSSVIESLPSVSMESNPNSPSCSANNTAEEDKDQRAFRKSLMVLWNRIASHKSANVFRKPISDDTVTGYSKKVRRPMDLSTIKKNIESGVIKTVATLERDVYLMFLNSIMFNPTSSTNSELSVFDMTTEMEHDIVVMIEDFKNAQKLMKSPPDNDKKDESPRVDSDAETESGDESKFKASTPAVKSVGRKRRNLSVSLSNAEDGKEPSNVKRRTLRTSTAAATTATTAWQSSRKKLIASPDIVATRND